MAEAASAAVTAAAGYPSALTGFLGATATVTTIGQFLSGIPTVQKVKNQGSAGDISPFPFLMGTVGSVLWLAYGQMKEDSMIIYCNIVGTLMNAIYVLIFIRYVSRRLEFLRQILMSLIFLAIILAVSVFNGDPVQGLENLGRVCILISLVCCGSPLIALKHVIRTKCTDSLPFPLILFMFLVCSQWWLYGILTSDPYMQITNLFGTLLALIQLSLFAIFPSTSSNSPHHLTKVSSEHKYDLLKS